jgi:hypothetical protein
MKNIKVQRRNSIAGRKVRHAEENLWTLVKVEESGIALWVKKLSTHANRGMEQVEKLVCASFFFYYLLQNVIGTHIVSLLLCIVLALKQKFREKFNFIPIVISIAILCSFLKGLFSDFCTF